MIFKADRDADIRASQVITTRAELERAIKDALTDDLCIELVNLAYSEDGAFSDDAFIDADTFWDVHSSDSAQDIVQQFFNGEDLDSRGPANPNRDYFRFNGYGNVESTDYPGDIYMDQLDIDITDYVLDHLDDREFPDEIQELVDNYLENINEE